MGSSGLNNTTPQELAIQDGQIWKDHFEKLYTHQTDLLNNPNQLKVIEKLNALESCIKNNQNPLNYPITQEELSGKLKSLKCNKSCGPDNIKNEMLKNSSPELQMALLKLFNLTLSSGVFPEVWNTGLISPIFKSGDKTDPNNYRGICVTSNLANVFYSLKNSRISSFLEQQISNWLPT